MKSLYENSRPATLCSARIQAGSLGSSRCPPEGGRCIAQIKRARYIVIE